MNYPNWSVGNKRARFDAKPSEESRFGFAEALKQYEQDTGQVQDTREGKKPAYKFFRWVDSSGNGTSKNYVSFGWPFNPAIEGYKRAGIVSFNMTNQYNAAHLFRYIGVRINEISTPLTCTSHEAGTNIVNPTFLLPNLVWLQGAQNPVTGITSDVVYFDPTGECMSFDLRGMTLPEISVTLCDENMQVLTPLASPTNYNMYMLLKLY